MAVAFTHLTSAGDTTNATTYSTASVSPTSGSLLLAWVIVSDADDPGTISISSGLTGVTWTEQFNQPYNTVAVPVGRMKLWTGVGATGSGTITFSGMPDACTGALWFIVEATGQHATPIVQAVSHTPAADASVTTETCTFAAYASSSNAVICAFGHNGTAASSAETPAWTAVDTEKSYATPDRRMWVQYQTSATDTSSTQTWAAPIQPAVSGGVEIAVGGTNASVTTTTVAAVTAIPAPTVAATADVTTTTVAAVAAVPAPTVTATAAVTTTTVAAVAAIPAPSISTTGSADVTTATVAAVSAIPAPTVAVDADVTTTTVAAVVAIPTPAISQGVDATTTTVTGLAAVPAPVVSGTAARSPPTVAAVAAIPAPSVAAVTPVTPSTVAAVAVLATYTEVSYTTERVETVSTLNNVNYNTDSFTPTPDSLLILAVSGVDNASTFSLTSITTFSGTALTWTNIASGTERNDGTTWNNWGLYYAIAPSSTAATVVRATWSEALTGCLLWIGEFDGFNSSAPVTQSDVLTLASGTETHALPSPVGARSLTVYMNTSFRNPPAWDASADGWTEVMDNGESIPQHGMFVAYKAGDQTIAFTGTDIQAGSIIAEIAPEPTSSYAVTVGVGPSITSTTVAAVAAPRTPTVTGTAADTTTTVATAASVPTPTVAAPAAVTTTTVAATTAIPAPTVTTSAAITPATVAATVAISTPNIVGGSDVSLTSATVNSTVAVPVPAISRTAAVTTTTVARAVVIPTPAISAAANASVTTTTVQRTVTIPTPTVAASASSHPARVAATTAIPTPVVVVSANIAITTSTVQATAAVSAPTVEAGASVTTSLVAATAAVPTPDATVDFDITPDVVAATVAVPSIVPSAEVVIPITGMTTVGGTAPTRTTTNGGVSTLTTTRATPPT